jgi:hypothetical protein
LLYADGLFAGDFMQSAVQYIALFAKNRNYIEKLQFKFVRIALNYARVTALQHKSADRLG